jgi:hypothetical protein
MHNKAVVLGFGNTDGSDFFQESQEFGFCVAFQRGFEVHRRVSFC